MMNRRCGCLQWCLFVLWLSALTHSCGATLRLGFAEEDVNTRESDKMVEITITTQGTVSEPVTVEIVPMDIERLRELGKDLPFNQQSATSGADFNAAVQRITIPPGHLGDVTVRVEIVDDAISETEEMFAVFLQVVDGGSNVQLLRDRMTVLIRTDSTDTERTIVRFNMASLRVSEGVGVVNSTVFIELEGEAQPPLMVNLQMTANRDDIIIFSTTIVILPSARRVPVPFQISDDLIYEGDETLQISLSRPANYRQLYHLGYPNTLSLTIQDNDIAHIAMETTNNTTTLLEGESTQVCVKLLEPSEIDNYIDLKIVEVPRVLSSAPHVNVQGVSNFYLFDSSLIYCLTLWALEDDVITPSWTLTFQLILDPFVYDVVANTSIVLLPDEVQLVVLDNDGIPNSPSDVKVELINQGKDMLVAWTATATPLQPVKQYVVEVEGQTTQVTRRQTSVHGNNVRQRYVTTDTEIVIEGLNRGMEYTVTVCAENTIGRACVDPLIIINAGDPESPPRTGGVLLGGSEGGLPVWVYIVSSVGLVVMVAVLVCLLALCFCYRAKKINSYYPSKQESKMMNKDKSIKESYRVTSASIDSSTASTDWELVTNNKEFQLNIV